MCIRDRVDKGNDPSGGLDQLAFNAYLIRVGDGHPILGMDGVYAHEAQVRVVKGCLAGGNLAHIGHGFL